MFLVNGMKATIRQFNRIENNEAYDDQQFTTIEIKLCPYNVGQSVKFGVYTHPEATGYYIVKRTDDVREGDQVIFTNGLSDQSIKNEVHTVLKVSDNWIYNRVENKIIAVK